MKISWKKHRLNFKFRAGTSRGILKNKLSYFILIEDNQGVTGIGECSLLTGLSPDDRPDIERKLDQVCSKFNENPVQDPESFHKFLDMHTGRKWPATRMAFETAFLDLYEGGRRIIFRNGFIQGGAIPINGLVWMGDRDFMFRQIRDKINEGFSCIKMKIGAIDIEAELDLLRYVRNQFHSQDIQLRVDANGAFNPGNVMRILKRLEQLKIHSIEQPIKAGQWEAMHALCRRTPVPIGLDEELIGEYDRDGKIRLVKSIDPQYIILKPSLLGGFQATSEWIDIARSRGIGWWITSALESNIGLNAICQFTYDQDIHIEQGLGTGQLYTNNIECPLELYRNSIRYNNKKEWDLSQFGIDRLQQNAGH